MIFIPVKITDKKKKTLGFNFLFDTGCGKTQISHDTAKELELSPRDGKNTMKVSSVAGEIHGYLIDLSRISIFNKDYYDFEVGVVDIALTEKSDLEIDGLIGMDIIGKHNLLIKGPDKQIKVLQ